LTRLLATADDDHSIRLWDTATGNERSGLIGHIGPVRSLVFARDDRRLYSGGEDTTSLVWDVAEVMKPGR
jgi:WD40 repeat protein